MFRQNCLIYLFIDFYPCDLLSPFLTGQGSSKGKRALYSCKYCSKDITGQTRIKCAECPDFELCVQCFSVGVEVTPHKSNHSYRVMVSKRSSKVFYLDNLLNYRVSMVYVSND